MTTRERNLATILLAGGVILAVGVVANALFLQPFSNIRTELDKAEQQRTKLEMDIKGEQNQIARIEQLNPRLAQWQKLSLPEGDHKTEAFKAHLSKLRLQYQG